MKHVRQSIGAVINLTGLVAVASQLTGFFN